MRSSADASSSPHRASLGLSEHASSSSPAHVALAHFEPLIPLPLDATAERDSGSEAESEARRITFAPPLSSDLDAKNATGQASLTDANPPVSADDKANYRRRRHTRRRTVDRLDQELGEAEPKAGGKLLRARSLRVERRTRDLAVHGEDRMLESPDPVRASELGRKASMRTRGEAHRRRSLSYTSDEPVLRRRGSRRTPARPTPTSSSVNAASAPPSSVIVSPSSSVADPRSDQFDAVRVPSRRPIEVGPSHFSKIRLLGKGDVGRVYLVRDKHAGTLYAMKGASRLGMAKLLITDRTHSAQ